ncbi:MBL fold metallo-hydrolase [Streptomyces sp. A7024]|uniref:MBL fold metallo-hydrolase n=1 Tax=Streptomyces coryli TaxID=1128680 RepID=A0A6G4U0D4_9ACTN|nr:MBL fold metallo-hydrolase [Streptomyces coryli]NGN64838.1 MBL fold metallo-hydrolase [Streptomyces coryli]
MRLTVLGGCGAWPAVDDACSGFLVEHDGFRLVLDLGYAVMPRLLRYVRAEDVDAVVITHGHPDHCADLNPLLRARSMTDGPPPAPLPLHAPPGSLDAVLALDRPGMLDDAYELREFEPGAAFAAGPFQVTTKLLPHMRVNAGLRVAAGGRVLAYTGDTGPSSAIAALARGADVFVAEASYPDKVPADMAEHLSTARQAGADAERAGAARLLLTHLMPGTDRAAAIAAARVSYGGDVAVAESGLVVEVG